MKTYKTITTLFFASILGLFLIAINPVDVYAGFGISPSTIDNETIKRGTKLVQDMVISRSQPDEKMTAIIEPDLGELNAWVTFDPGPRIVLPEGEQRVGFKVIIDVPQEVALKDYEGVFRVYAEPEGQVKGVSVVEGARVDISLTTTEVSIVDLSIRAVRIPDTYVDEDLFLELTAHNKGNSNAAPTKVEIEVQSLLEKSIKTLTSDEIEEAPAYQVSTVKGTFRNHGLQEGEYYGLISVYDGSDVYYKDRVVFKVLPKRIYEEVCSGMPLVVANNLSWIFFGFSGVGLLVLSVALKKNKTSKRKKQEKKKRTAIYIIVFVLFEALIFPLIYLNIFGLFDGKCEIVQVLEETDIAMLQGENTSDEEIAEPTSQIQGISTDSNKDKVDSGNLNVAPGRDDGKYKVYREANLSSAVVYLAEEGEKFEVIEERAQWYRVQMNDGTDGWLPKQNVRESIVEEVQ